MMDVLGLPKDPELPELLPRVVGLYDTGIPPIPPNVTAAQVWPASAPILDHVAFFSTFPDSRPCPSPQFWNNLRSSRTMPSSYVPEMNIQELTIGIATKADIKTAARKLKYDGHHKLVHLPKPISKIVFSW